MKIVCGHRAACLWFFLSFVVVVPLDDVGWKSSLICLRLTSWYGAINLWQLLVHVHHKAEKTVSLFNELVLSHSSLISYIKTLCNGKISSLCNLMKILCFSTFSIEARVKTIYGWSEVSFPMRSGNFKDLVCFMTIFEGETVHCWFC